MMLLFKLLSLLSFVLTSITTAYASEFPPIPGQRYDIGGYSLHLSCKGEGSPTVIIDTGLGDDSTDWLAIQHSSAKFSKVCVYDRPGYGWSDIGPYPRNSAQIAIELDKLVTKAALKGPYILVGHSFGGYNMRLYANNHPNKVVGMILIDASHERQYEKLNIRLPQHNQRDGNVLILPKSSNAISSKPSALRERAIHAAGAEINSLYQSAQQVKNNPSLPRIPLIVVTRGKSEWRDQYNAQHKEQIWRQLQQDLWRLSPISQHIFANRSGHDIHQEQPDVVVNAISDILAMSQL